jgi:hypothetical protein
MIPGAEERKAARADARAFNRPHARLRTAAAALLLVSACAAAPTYKPPDTGAPHAIVASSSKFTLLGLTSMTLREVDGKTTRREERIAPGNHLVTFLYASGQQIGVNPCHVSLQAQAGRRYRAEVDDRNRAALICWLLDEQTGEKIEGYFGSLEPTMKGAE